MKVSFYALKFWQWSSKILMIHNKNTAFLFSVLAMGYTGGSSSAGFRDEVIALLLNSQAFSEVCSATAVFTERIFQTVPYRDEVG